MRKSLTLAAAAAGTLALVAADAAVAAECDGPNVPHRTRLDASTIDSLLDKCLDGKKIRDLIAHERFDYVIRNFNLPMELISNNIPANEEQPYRLIEATEKYKGSVQYDPATRQLSNYKAGVPFPDVDASDPEAGAKIIWNYRYGRPKGDQFGSPGKATSPNFVFTLSDGNSGVERIQRWNFSRYYTIGRVTGGPEVLGEGDVFSKALLFAVTPQDIKGVGTFTIAYDSAKLDDVWVYIRSVRRIRRLSGGAWFDPIGGTDQLQDDIGFNANPGWYQGFKVLGKKWVLHPTDSQQGIGAPNTRASWQSGKTTIAEEFPRLVTDQAPYWQMLDLYMPREAWVVEATPPTQHPYSKRIVFIDAKNWNYLHQVTYDQKGEFWKTQTFAGRYYDTADGFIDPRTGKVEKWVFEAWGYTADYQRRHATNFHVAEDFAINTQGTTSDDFTFSTLESAGR